MILIIIWELAYRLGVDTLQIWKPYTFPSPLEVSETLLRLIRSNALGIAIGASMKRLFIGYMLSLIIGIAIGLIIVRLKYIGKYFSQLILGLQTLPSICWLPFAVLWYGLNERAIIFVIAIGSTFSVSMAIESAIKNINPIYLKAAKTMGACGIKLYVKVVIPSALPEIVSGMKQGWSFAWRALMAGEMLFATKGLGQILMIGRDLANISQVVAIMIVIVILGLTIDHLIFDRIQASIRYRWGLDKQIL